MQEDVLDQPQAGCPRLHVYGMKDWGDDVVITGNQAGLITLKDAINQAILLTQGTTGRIHTTDGDDYHAVVIMVEGEMNQKRLPPPYAAQHTQTSPGTRVESVISFLTGGLRTYYESRFARRKRPKDHHVA